MLIPASSFLGRVDRNFGANAEENAFMAGRQLAESIQAAKEKRAEEALLQALGGLGQEATPVDVMGILNRPRQPKEGLAAIFDIFNPTTPSGGMTALERNIRGGQLEDIYRQADPMYRMKMGNLQTDTQRGDIEWDQKQRDRRRRIKKGKSVEGRAVQDQDWQAAEQKRKKAEYEDPLTSPRGKALRHRIDQLQRQRDNAWEYGQDDEVKRIDQKIDLYQAELDAMNPPAAAQIPSEPPVGTVVHPDGHMSAPNPQAMTGGVGPSENLKQVMQRIQAGAPLDQINVDHLTPDEIAILQNILGLRQGQ